MGAAFEVYNFLGYGMAEEIYQQSLEIELQRRSIPFASQPTIEVEYKTIKLQAFYRPDMLVHSEIVVELKAVAELASEHEAQLFNYLRICNKKVGYLINFGHKAELQWKRFVI